MPSHDFEFTLSLIEWCKQHGVNDGDAIRDLYELIKAYHHPKDPGARQGISSNDYKTRRLLLRLTQIEVARTIGITPSHLSLVENGERGMSVKIKTLLDDFYNSFP